MRSSLSNASIAIAESINLTRAAASIFGLVGVGVDSEPLSFGSGSESSAAVQTSSRNAFKTTVVACSGCFGTLCEAFQ